jgi:3-oxoacyl-[acyl-carrier protein] reductase
LGQGRYAMVTGAGAPGGIGLSAARALGQAGFRLAICGEGGRIHARAAELLAEGFVVAAHQADLTEAAQVQQLFDRTGPVDVLVHSAGVGSLLAPAETAPFLDPSSDPVRRALDVSLTSAVLVTRAYLPAMLSNGWGRVIMLAPTEAVGLGSDLGSDKAGMAGFARTLALEVAARGVTVNTVAPAWIATTALSVTEGLAAQLTPTRRAGRPDEVAACIAFLASEAASYVNGSTLVVDGGHSLQESRP